MTRARAVGVVVAAAFLGPCIAALQARAVPAPTVAAQTRPIMKIRIAFNARAVTATLAESPAAREFFAQLPLTLSLKDYAATEKIAYLPRKLRAIEGGNAGLTPEPGDIAYYAPWGNLAIFYKGADHAQGLVKLGHVHEGAEWLATASELQVTISKE